MVLLLLFGVLAYIVVAIIFQVLPASWRSLVPASSEDVSVPLRCLWSVLLAIVAYNMFAYESSGISAGTSAFAVLMIVAFFSALPRAKQTFFAWCVAGIGIFASAAFAFRANEFVQAVNVTVVFFSIAMLLVVHAVDRIEWNAMWLLRTAFLYPALVFQRLPGTVRLFKPGKISGLSVFMRTLFFTLVLVFFFVGILSNADLIFAQTIRVLPEEIVPRTMWSIALAAIMVLGLASQFGKSYTYRPLPLRFLSWMETVVPVGAVCVVFGIFLWVQATYLFADHQAFSALNLTYAQYVRKGMIEVLIATACAGVLSYIVSLKERELAGSRERGILYGINVVLLIELFLMLGSALKRDWMYMEVYGLTRVRVVGEIFLAWLVVVVLVLAAFALWRRLREKVVFAGAIAASFVVVFYLNIFNIDAAIVSATPPHWQSQDAYYMSLLSVDAVNEWETMIRAIVDEYEVIRTRTVFDADERMRLANVYRAVQELSAKRRAVLDAHRTGWMLWRWSDAHAARVIDGSAVFGATLDCVSNGLANLRAVSDVEWDREIGSLEGDFRRPFVHGPLSSDWYVKRTGALPASCR